MLKLEISLAAEVAPLILEPHVLAAREIVILIILMEFFASLQFNSLLSIGIQHNIHLSQLCLTKNCQPIPCFLIFCYSAIRRSDYKMVTVDTVQDFLNKLGIKPCIHLWEISIFSLNKFIIRPTKITNRAAKNWAHF